VPDAARPAPFIGRAAELARLEAALGRATDGFGGIAIVGGEAGIGKTCLLEHFAAGCRERGDQVLIGGCLEFTGVGVAFAPFVEILHSLLASAEPARWAALLGPGRRDLGRLAPEVASAPGDHHDRDDLDPSAQARLFEAVLGVLERVGRRAPAILIIEDVQWADDDTRDLLTFLARHLRATRVLMILSLRTAGLDGRDPTSRFVGELERDDGVVRIELSAFDRHELAGLLASRSTRPPASDWLDDVLARTSGNPFYALQLLDMRDGGERVFPPRLRDVLLVQLGGLSPAAREVVRLAAAAGMTFDDDLLGAVTGTPRAEVAAGLREAIESGVLVDSGSSSDGHGYTFRHALVREVADAELLAGERARLHARFARALLARRRRGDRVSAAAISFHLDASGDDRRAVPALIEAGAEAESAFAFAVARRYYERALELWDGAAEPLDVAGTDRPGLMLRAAECSVLTGLYRVAIALGRKAISSLETVQPPDADRLGRLHERLRWYLWEAGDDAGAEAEVDEALRLIPAEPPSAQRARVLGQAAGLRMYAGDPSATELASEAISVAIAAQSLADEAFARAILGWCQALAGDVDSGLSTYRSGLAIAERLGGAEGIALGHANYAALLDRVGRTEASLAAALDGVAVVRRLGVSRTYGGMLLGHATKALFDLGRWDEALSMATQGLDLDPVGLSAIWLHINHARLDTNRGAFDVAAEHLRQARELGPSVGRSQIYEIALLAAQADLARWEGKLETVRGLIQSGVAMIDAGRPLDPAFGWLAATGLRAEGDAAMAARARHDTASLSAATGHGANIVEIFPRLSRIPAWSADARRDAILALCKAEVGRLTGTPADSSPASWRDVGRRWEVVGRPYPAAYARYRAAEAILERRGSRDEARALLKEALDVTDRLAAVPLHEEIGRLAHHARIEVGAGPTPARSGQGGPGLTKREAEVIQLVAAGWSNQQIADALFITRKTASVHVSNIMAKVGATNRGEAAAVAYQLGLAGQVGAPPRA
jgi:DNA-binding CsgD family transcriptional regulator